MKKPTVVVHFDTQGNVDYQLHGDVDLFLVDDRVPFDRVYHYTLPSTPEEFSNLIPSGTEIGSCHDDCHKLIAERVKSLIEGRPHLTVVSPDGDN